MFGYHSSNINSSIFKASTMFPVFLLGSTTASTVLGLV